MEILTPPPSSHVRFGVLLWQICALRDPYEDMFHIKQYHQWIVQEGRRPDSKLVKNETLRTLICECWDSNPNSRPKFTAIRERLEAFLADHDCVPAAVARASSNSGISSTSLRSAMFKSSGDEPSMQWMQSSSHLTDTASSRGSSMFDLSRGTNRSGSVRQLDRYR